MDIVRDMALGFLQDLKDGVYFVHEDGTAHAQFDIDSLNDTIKFLEE